MKILKKELPASDLAKLVGVTKRTIRKARQGRAPALARVQLALEGKTIPDTTELEAKRAREKDAAVARTELWDSVRAFTLALEGGGRRQILLTRDRFHRAKKISTSMGIWFQVPARLKEALANEKKDEVSGSDLLKLSGRTFDATRSVQTG